GFPAAGRLPSECQCLALMPHGAVDVTATERDPGESEETAGKSKGVAEGSCFAGRLGEVSLGRLDVSLREGEDAGTPLRAAPDAERRVGTNGQHAFEQGALFLVGALGVPKGPDGARE